MLMGLVRGVVRAVAIVSAIAIVLAPTTRATDVKDTIIGTAFSPAHVPYSTDDDIRAFFEEAAQIGNHVTWIIEWQSMPPLKLIQTVRQVAMLKGFKFHLYLSPIALAPGRKSPAIPAAVGASSFSDGAARKAFIAQALTLASLRADYLGLGTEVNFLAQNPGEFAAYVTLARETYQAIKKQYPAQTVTISFQWDVMWAHKQFPLLAQFADSLDVYSFTSYPDAFGSAPKLPDDYYSAVRQALPKERLGFSELGWSSAPPSDEDAQAEFWKRVPDLMRGARAEFITLAMLHDVSLFNGDLARLNFVGIRTIDDAPKKSWDVVLRFPSIR